MNDPTRDTLRRQCRALIGAASALDGVLTEAEDLGGAHQAKLAHRLDAMTRELELLLHQTQRLGGTE